MRFLSRGLRLRMETTLGNRTGSGVVDPLSSDPKKAIKYSSSDANPDCISDIHLRWADSPDREGSRNPLSERDPGWIPLS